MFFHKKWFLITTSVAGRVKDEKTRILINEILLTSYIGGVKICLSLSDYVLKVLFVLIFTPFSSTKTFVYALKQNSQQEVNRK